VLVRRRALVYDALAIRRSPLSYRSSKSFSVRELHGEKEPHNRILSNRTDKEARLTGSAGRLERGNVAANQTAVALKLVREVASAELDAKARDVEDTGG
jgi:hypothetical protein